VNFARKMRAPPTPHSTMQIASRTSCIAVLPLPSRPLACTRRIRAAPATSPSTRRPFWGRGRQQVRATTVNTAEPSEPSSVPEPPTEEPEQHYLPQDAIKYSGLSTIIAQALDPHVRVSSSASPGDGISPTSDAFWGAMGVMVSFLLIGWLDNTFCFRGAPFMLGSFGTLSVLLFAAPSSEVLHPWNIVIGHLAGAVFAISCFHIGAFFMWKVWVTQAMAMGLLIGFMMLAGCVHPPGGAAVMGFCSTTAFQALDWRYLFYPGLTGAALLVSVAMVTNYCKRNFRFGMPTAKPVVKTA